MYEEHSFWLEILEDHAHFIHDFLSPSEIKWVRIASQFIQGFKQLRQRLKGMSETLPDNSPIMINFARESYQVASSYFKFEGTLQSLRILNKVNLNLTPTYLNGTLNENQEYLRLLNYYVLGKKADELSLVRLLDLWLEDQLGHALLLQNSLDPIEIPLAKEAEFFIQGFRAHMVKNHTIKGYLRFLENGFPGHQLFSKQVGETVAGFNQLVEKVILLYKNDNVFNRTTLRFLEHHFPESCYFLIKLANFEPELKALAKCSLTKPSFHSLP
ncbi:DUF2935 domain-containing protein [Halobacillus karajensis]|uniref:DUF2935 domain-containing protein n=1 Tax=Halobacillus karajensis TaxID=195088 RepID=UPI00245423D9|nr:DUF2935 domain-containing protein [Halobacillus karajensis]